MRRLVCCLVFSVPAAFADGPNLGVPIEESAADSITIFADGRGLPPGSGDVAAGKALFETQCAACHGAGGQQGTNDWLVGGHVALDEQPRHRTVGSYWPYAPPLFDYIRRAMPYRNPGTLTSDEIYALVAYLLHANGLWPQDQPLDAKGLAGIKMPNRARFFSRYPLPP